MFLSWSHYHSTPSIPHTAPGLFCLPRGHGVGQWERVPLASSFCAGECWVASPRGSTQACGKTRRQAFSVLDMTILLQPLFLPPGLSQHPRGDLGICCLQRRIMKAGDLVDICGELLFLRPRQSWVTSVTGQNYKWPAHQSQSPDPLAPDLVSG